MITTNKYDALSDYCGANQALTSLSEGMRKQSISEGDLNNQLYVHVAVQ
jgi:hypothetical protein